MIINDSSVWHLCQQLEYKEWNQPTWEEISCIVVENPAASQTIFGEKITDFPPNCEHVKGITSTVIMCLLAGYMLCKTF